jgi:heat-inducible transcriptional repressor
MTERQIKLLGTIIEQYAEVAAPVGSVTLAKLFGVSSATIRSEMVKLEDLGYIRQPHTSAGRIPTDKGYRFYVNLLTETRDDEATPQFDRSARAIDARVAGHVDQLYISGMGNLFAQPEFASTEHVQQIARLLDNLEPWLREASPNEPLNVYIGAENPIGKSSGASLIISRFRSPYSDRSYIGVLGPTRQDYARVMRLVRHTGAMLEEVL